MNGILFSVGLVLLFLLGVVDSTGKLTIKLNYYDNVQGTLYDGTCCDSDVGHCLFDKCDLTFDVCVGKHRDEYDCTYGSKKVIAQPNTNEIEFSDSFDFLITNSIKDPLFVRVNVTDVDSGEGTALVDAFHYVYNTAANFNSSLAEYQSYLITGERKQNPTKLNISLASYCDQNYYGERCSVRCVPESFGCDGHYTCGSDGSKLCLAGWTGDNCDEQIPGGEADCSFYKDSMELLPSLWEGSYSCPNEISQTLQMNIPLQQPGDVVVSANLSFGGMVLTARGSFFMHHLVISGHPSPNDRNITNAILVGNQQQKNLTYITGVITFTVSNGERKCPFTLNMKKSYFSSCGGGTCVRYGQKKEQFYCCCNQNSHSATTHCDTTTTLSTTPSTTTSTTTTKETTTEKPTTQKPTTEMVTTQKSTTTTTTVTPSPTSHETTTTTPQTTTKQITTEPSATTTTTTKSTTTTLQTTTQAPETTESTTVTTQPPTTTTTTLPPSTKTTSTTNRPTTPKVTPSNPPEQVIQESFFINLLDDEVDNTLTDAIMDAYVEANKDNKEVQKKNMDFPDGIPVHKYIYENRKYRGELLAYVKYNISITGVSTPVKVLTLNDIQAQIRKRYASNVKVYGHIQRDLYPEGGSFHLDVYGPGPSDDEMATWEQVILDVYRTEKKCSMDSTACQLYDVSIKCTDEYMDYEGKEVTRLYVFVFNGILAQPPNDTVPYIQALERHSGIQARFYLGSQDKHDLLWYRHHYDLIVEGSVVQSDLPEFVKRLQRAWYQAQTFYYCTLCNVSIHRTEKFVGENGEELTAIVYFFKVREIFSFPNLDGNLNPHQYLDMNKFMDINGNPYKLYNGTKVYRYRHGYNVLIEGQVDSKDRSLFTAVLKQAWLDYNVTLLTTITPSYLIEEYTSSSGDLVSNIVCFISYDGVDIDARLTPTPSMSWLLQWTVNQSNLGFARAGGQVYQVYTKYSLSQLVLRTNLFSMYFEGYLKIDHWTDIAASLQSAWNFTNFSGKNISIQIIKSNTYSIYFKREAVTMLSYALYVDGELVPPFTVLYSQRTLVYNTSMISLATRFPVYVLKDRLLDRRDQFTLYFTTKINYLDFDGGLRTQLLDVIKRKWHDSHQYTNLNLYIDYQEKVYGTESLVLWKLVFYLMSENREIHSQFVTSITHQLFQSEEIKGLSGHLYQLYKGQMSSAWLSYNSHFTLTFDRQVSELDWSKVRQTLRTEWCRSRFSCGSGQDITITIKEQEQYWNEVTRQWYWQLVYFVHHKNQLISSSSHTSIQTSKLDFSWTNVYNGTYSLTLASGGLGWRFSKSFYLWTEEHLTVSAESRDKIGVALLQAWFKMNVRSDLKNCNCISIHVLPQQRYYAGNGKSLWKLTYFISYKNKVVMDAHSWPSLTTSLIDWSIVTSSGVKVRTDIDLYYYMYMMKFSLKHKLSVSEYGKVEKALTQEYILKHPGCGCGVSISHQEEVIDSQGKSSWIVYYHLVKNGTYQKPSSYSPINWTLFNSKHHFTTVDGHELDFAWSWYGKQHYIGYSQSGSLFLQTWVPPSLYGRFAGWLKWYYERFYKGSTVEVEMTNTTREYKQKDGSSAWHLPFILKVNGSLITPPSINSTTFETTFNATSQWKQKFTLVHTDEVTDGNKVFSVHFNHKVSEPAKEEIKKAIIATFVQQHPGVNSSLVNLTFGSQQEIFSSSKNQTTETTGKSSSWELTYTISIGGSEVDTRETTTLNTSLLTSNLNVTGPNKVKYKVITNTESGAFISARRVSSLYVTSFVSVEDVKKMEKSIALAWKKQYNSSEEVKVTFLRQKQYINSKGEVVWKWDYTLSLNSSHLVRAEIPPVNHAHLQVAISNLESVRKYQLVQSTVSFLDYQMHFPLYLTTKMAKEDKKEFKAKLEQAWAKEGLGAVLVQIVNQEEIIHKTTGQSSWKLVYFLKHNMTDNVIDSRVTENINASHLYHVVGPRGVYRYITHLDSSQYLSKSMSKSIVINTKLDIKGKTRIQHEVAELLKENITDSVLKSSVSIEIAGQEEYFTTQNERAWRILYFIRLGGVYVPASSLLDVDQTRLAARLYNFTTTNTQKFRILKESDLLYIYRNAFSVYFTSKVAASHFYSIQQLLLETWKKAKVYQQCNCLAIHEIAEHHQEEVINSNGVSYWKLNYFIRNNGTVIEAMTHQPLELGEFSTVLSSVNNVKGKSYKVKAITETVVRSRMMFSFHMTSEIGYTHKDKFQTSLKAAWSRQQPDIFKDGEVSIKIFRNTRYVDVVKRTAVWRVDYVIEKSGLRIDPLEIPPLPARELQQNLTFTDPKGAPYQLVDQLTSLLDYRIHFALFVSAEVKSSDFIHFGSALAQYWSSKDFTNGSATVSFQERYVNMYGKMLWKLVVFMKNGSDYLDSRTSEEVNTTEIENSVTFTNSLRKKYQLVNVQSNTLRRYEAGFSLCLSHTVLRSDLSHMSSALRETWTKTDTTLNNVSVEVVSQEKYYSKIGLTNKILYFLSVDGLWVDSGMLGNMNLTILQQNLLSLSTTNKYELVVVENEDLYRYEWLFTIDLLMPLLSVDYSQMKYQLAEAWMINKSTNFKNLTVRILDQENLISGKGVPVYRVLYALIGNSKMQRATQRDPLEERARNEKVKLVKYGTGISYVSRIYSGGDLYRYTDLYSLHFQHRVADYSLLEGQLKEAWNTTVDVEGEKIQKVTIVGQEKILLNTGESAFRLLYHVTSRHEDYTINRPLITGPSHDALIKHVKVEDLKGATRKVLNVTEGFRMSQVFSVVVNRRVYMSDQSKFESSLLLSLQNHWTDVSSAISFTVRSTERVVDKHSRQMLWRYSYVITMNGHPLDVSRHAEVGSETLTSSLNFTSPSNINYVAVDAQVGSYEEMFSLQVENIQNTKKSQDILGELSRMWSKHSVSGIVIGELLWEEYLSSEGLPVTKFSYFVNSTGGSPMYPSVTRPPSYVTLTSDLGLRLFTGQSSLRYTDCFRLYVSLPLWTVDRTSVQTALTEVWQQQSPSTKNITIRIVNGMDSFVGKFGLQLSAFRYTISYQSSGQTRVITPDMTIHPESQKVQSALSTQNSRLTVYLSSPVRTRSLFHVSLRYLKIVTMTVGTVQSVSSKLKEAWSSLNMPSKVETQVVSTKEYRTISGRSQVTRLYYHVQINNKTTEPWEDRVHPAKLEEILAKLVQNDSSLRDRFVVNNQSETQVYTLFIEGHQRELSDVQTAIKSSWQDMITSGSVVVNTHGAQRYVSDDWKDVTKLAYTVTINGSSPEALEISPPSFERVEASLKKVSKAQCPCYAKKARKEYLLGTKTSLDVAKVQEALKSVWTQKNQGIRGQKFTVKIKDVKSRQKRGTESAPIQTKLVGKNNKEITPVQYMVALEGHDPDPSFVATPSSNDLAQPLTQAGAAPCGCTPKLAGSFQLKGNTNPNDKGKITDAIADAFANENQDVNKNNIIAEAKLNNTKSNGDDVTVVDYTIQRSDDEAVETLKSPKRVDLERSLSTVGKTLYSRAPVPPPKEEDKKLAIYIAVAVVAFIILVLIICYIVYLRRRRKMGNLLKREQTVKEKNFFDSEHFSEPAASHTYKNPNFEPDPAMKEDLRNV